ncbi:hypothetical protein O988_08858 [Pseudogymnoascus sp. VKM F-3808]|nr:hypothetical protein O988_08858 [Pseudogymnoascus sp. VKM F-3808]
MNGLVMGGGGGGSSVALAAKALFSPCAHIVALTKTALLRKIGALNPSHRMECSNPSPTLQQPSNTPKV